MILSFVLRIIEIFEFYPKVTEIKYLRKRNVEIVSLTLPRLHDIAINAQLKRLCIRVSNLLGRFCKNVPQHAKRELGAYADIKGSVQPAHMRSLARVSAVSTLPFEI